MRITMQVQAIGLIGAAADYAIKGQEAFARFRRETEHRIEYELNPATGQAVPVSLDGHLLGPQRFQKTR